MIPPIGERTVARFFENAFTAAAGGSLHCEPLATGLRSQRVFDWLDATLDGAGSPASGRVAHGAAAG